MTAAHPISSVGREDANDVSHRRSRLHRALACEELIGTGRHVRGLDAMLYEQREVAGTLATMGVELVEGDIRETKRRRGLDGVDEIVHLAAIVGDPACARDPEVSQAVNVDAALALVDEASTLGARRLVFASTCSNYGRMADPTTPIDETGQLAPVSLYAEQKVAVERAILGGRASGLTGNVPAIRDRVRRRSTNAIRPHSQRVHPRPLGRPRPRGVRRAVLAPLHPRA